MAPVESLTDPVVAAAPQSKHAPPVKRDAEVGPGDAGPMRFEDPSGPDAEYQQWRREQLRQLELRYPEWHRNSYKDFIESFPHACRPSMAARPLPRALAAGRRLAGAAVFGK